MVSAVERTITIARKESNYNSFKAALVFDMRRIYNIFTPKKTSEVLEIKDFRAMIRAM